jgi:type IV pilus assembly protein PilB
VNVALLSSLVSRIKIMSNLDISERRVPQDGRMTITLNGRPVDLRVTTLPTVYGEKIVLRILDNASAPLELVDVGLSDYHLDVYKRHYHKPYGMILMTGPTGSGKSTTLYATLNTIRSDAVNIITVEDPVEYRISGINQVQINKKAGLTFATALRSILRADPDVVLVGEIRDPETARIAVEASLTGHLVLTTLHTNDASSAVTRLVEMGLEPFLVGSAVSLVVAQRLVRRLCDRCSEDFTPETEQLLAVNFPWEPGKPVPVLKKAKGCERCSGTGFRGRTAIHEMLEVTPQIERLANEGAHTDQIREAAVEHNDMRLMRQDGWEKVLAGVTTIEEVLRATA